MTTPRSFPSSAINDPYGSRDTGLDDTIESSFPASDPPSSIPDPTSDSNASYATDGAPGTVRRLALGWYLGREGGDSAYAAAASLLALLAWVYYSSQLVLFGAEFTYVYAHRYGSRRDAAPQAGS